jgi:hypothetical protein
MKPRHQLIFLAFLSLILIVLFITRNIWLSPLFQYISPRTAKIELIHTIIETISGLLAIISSAYTAYKGILLNRPDKVEQVELLVSTSLERFKTNLLGSKGKQIPWISRDEISSFDWSSNNHIVIIGRMKIGKTRVAVELIQRLIEDELSPDRIYDLSTSLRSYRSDSAKEYILRKLDRSLPAIFYIENLPIQYTGEALKTLTTVIGTLKGRCKYYFLITARSDQLKKEHLDWLDNNNFYTVKLSRLNESQIQELAIRAAKSLNLELEDSALPEFIEHSNGTPYHTILSLIRLSNHGNPQVDKKSAHEFTSKTLEDSWKDIRREIENIEPDSHFVFDAIASFYSAGVTPYENIIERYSKYLRVQKRGVASSLFYYRNYSTIINLLSNYDISIYGDIFNFPDAAVDDIKIEKLIACGAIGTFIERIIN